jgi:hypothetical protein
LRKRNPNRAVIGKKAANAASKVPWDPERHGREERDSFGADPSPEQELIRKEQRR